MQQKDFCLIIDTKPPDQSLFQKALDLLSPETVCLTASDGAEAIHVLREQPIAPKYIFIDLNSPRMNGFEFLGEMKKKKPLRDIPIIIYSITTRTARVRVLNEYGAFAIHFKTHRTKDLQTLFRKYLEMKAVQDIT